MLPDGAGPNPAAPRQSNRAVFSSAAWALLTCVLALGLSFDLLGKWWSFSTVAGRPVTNAMIRADPENCIPPHEGMHVLPANLLDMRLVVNKGAVFGIAPNKRFFFIAFTMAALAAGLLVFGRFTTAHSRLAHVAVALILAGGLGNLYDRIVIGVVRDYLHLLPGWRLPFGWRYPPALGGGNEVFPWVFNLADVMLLTGMALLMVHINRLERRRKAAEAHAKSAAGESVQAQA
jgi:signal peptidase II